MSLPTVQFLGETCTLELKKYTNGQTAIQLWTPEGPMATATVCLPSLLPKNYVYLKNYAENTGMAEAFEAASIGKITERVILHHDAEIAVFEITDPSLLAAI
jgi:hypothetical protein